jgi:hypothetical protein
MKLDLTPAQVMLLDTILGLDLGALGLTKGQERTAHTIHLMLHDGPVADADALGDRTAPIARQITAHDPLRVLRLTPSYRHVDK